MLYTAFDLSHRARSAKAQLLADLQRVQEPVLQATGIFCSGAGPAARQCGVLRTNCIDSLDRTNVAQVGAWQGAWRRAGPWPGSGALGQPLRCLESGRTKEERRFRGCSSWHPSAAAVQFTFGMLALGRQLHAMGIAGEPGG